MKQESFQDDLHNELQNFMASDVNLNYQSGALRSPHNLPTPFDPSDAPVFDYVTKRSTSQDKNIGNGVKHAINTK